MQLNFFLNSDRFGQAARLAEEIADMMSEDEKWDEAMKAYEEAANYFDTENDSSNANKRLEKMAHMATKLRKYEKAIPVFEKIAKSNVDNNLLRWSVKNYLFKASLCIINKNICENEGKFWIDVSNTFDKYLNISDLFASSRECKMITGMLEALKKVDEKAFKDAVSEFDSISPLDAWTTEQLLIMEKYIKDKKHEAPDILGDDNDNNNNDYKNNTNKNNNNNDVNVDDNWDENNNNDNDNNDNNDDNDKKKKDEVPVYDHTTKFNDAPDLDNDE
jgi:alpha-soluble NSF attachment protein